jgi:hypothetical protein
MLHLRLEALPVSFNFKQRAPSAQSPFQVGKVYALHLLDGQDGNVQYQCSGSVEEFIVICLTSLCRPPSLLVQFVQIT